MKIYSEKLNKFYDTIEACTEAEKKHDDAKKVEEEKKAVETGYYPLFHYNPTTKEFSTDSKADFSKYKDFLLLI